jgi:hypothetical protein
MPGIDKKGFLSRLEKKASAYESPMPGEGPAEEAAPGEESSEEMTCGDQLLAAVNAGDAAGIDAALREAVAKYGG